MSTVSLGITVFTAVLALQVSGSVGLVFHQGKEKTSADELLHRADLAMYQAKQAGKNRYQVFGEPLTI